MKIAAATTMVILSIGLWGAVAPAAQMKWSEMASCFYNSYAHEQQQQYDKAVKDLEPIRKAYPNNYTVNYRTGWLQYLNKDYFSALRYLGKAHAISPESIEVMNVITLVYAAKADWPGVEKEAKKVIGIDNYNITANYWSSYAMRMRGKYARAVMQDRKMLRVLPTSVLFLQELAQNLKLDNKKVESAATYSDLAILSPPGKISDPGSGPSAPAVTHKVSKVYRHLPAVAVTHGSSAKK